MDYTGVGIGTGMGGTAVLGLGVTEGSSVLLAAAALMIVAVGAMVARRLRRTGAHQKQ